MLNFGVTSQKNANVFRPRGELDQDKDVFMNKYSYEAKRIAQHAKSH